MFKGKELECSYPIHMVVQKASLRDGNSPSDYLVQHNVGF